jgi:CheY-like chemotaxis protein
MANPVKTGDAKLWVYNLGVFMVLTARLLKAMTFVSCNTSLSSPVDHFRALLLYCTYEMKWKRIMEKILVVEDNEDSRRMLVRLLGADGYEVAEADDGITAWEILQQEHIPLVITDWLMDQMDGIELVEHIRSSEFSNSTYVIMVTAHADSVDATIGYDVGVDAYMTKPLDLEELPVRVEDAFRSLNNFAL